MAMIPKIIWTIWIGEIPLPEKYKEWCATHKVPGWEHHYITLDNCVRGVEYCARGIKYIKEAIEAKKWIKVSDYLRIYYLYHYGGIYLDCDMEILKPLDDLLDNKLFACREDENLIGSSAIGAEKGNPLLGEYLKKVNDNFRGGGDMIREPGERLFTDLVNGVHGDYGEMTIYPDEYFFPYNEKTGKTTITPNTYLFHRFARSWQEKK